MFITRFPQKQYDDESSSAKREDSQQDDTETGDQEGESKEDSSKEEKGAAGEEEGSRFFNPDELPPELKPVFKRMQASFTRKMQALSGEKKKAEAFDELVSDPNFREWVQSRQSPVPEKQQQAKGDDDEPNEGIAALRKLVKEVVNEAVEPLHKDREERTRERVRERTQAQVAQLTKDWPMWRNYREEMAEVIRENPRLGYEQAFFIAAFPDVASKGMDSLLSKLKAAKQKQPEKSSGSSKGSDDRPPVPKTVKEAFALAKKQLGIS